jgi:hypothetical protein
MSGCRRTLLATLVLITVGAFATSVATAATPDVPADVAPKGGVPACVSARVIAVPGPGTRTAMACHPQCWYLDGRLVCMCKEQLTVACSVRCTVKCSRNRTYYTVGYAHTAGDDRLRGLRKCLKTAEGNARVSAFISYRKCRVTECRPVTGLAKPKVARAIYFGIAGAARAM